MAKQIDSFTMFVKVVCTDADPANWTVTRVGCDHIVGDSVATGAAYPKAGECPLETLNATQTGTKDTAGTLLKYAQDTKSAIETVEGI